MSGGGPYRATALVLRKTKLRETDLIVTLLKEDGSIARAVAHGARKPKSPFAARLEPCAVVDVLVSRGRSLDVVQEARFVESMGAVRADLDALSAALPIVELAAKTAEDGLENPRLYQCAVAALRLMDRTIARTRSQAGADGHAAPAPAQAVGACRVLCAACLLKELAFAGFRPSLAHCAACGEPLALDGATVAFDAREGGLLCDACAFALRPRAASPDRPPARRVGAEACLLARDLLHRPFADVAALQADPSHVRGVLTLARDLVEEHVGGRLRSLAFLLSAWS